jgi:dolichol-phosphate mannosyltransferase
LTVIVPTYNEAENLPNLVSALFALPLENLNLLIVDDNSPDGTGELAEMLAFEHPGCLTVLHRRTKAGLGTAYIAGFQYALKAGATAVAQMDADFSHPPEKLVELVDALQTCDIAQGSRYVPGGSVDLRWPLWRKGLSAWGNFYARTILGLPVRDVTGGFRLWRREALLGMPLELVRSNGYAFLIEIAYLAHLMGFTTKEVPIYFADRRWGQSKMSFRIQREAAIRVWQMRVRYRRLRQPR